MSHHEIHVLLHRQTVHIDIILWNEAGKCRHLTPVNDFSIECYFTLVLAA